MTIRELVKNEIDMLPDDALYAVRDFVLSQKEHLATGRTQTREKSIEWLEDSWIISGFTSLTRDKIYEAVPSGTKCW